MLLSNFKRWHRWLPLQLLLHWIIWGSKQINLREKRGEGLLPSPASCSNTTSLRRWERERESESWRPCFPALLPSPKSSVIELVLSHPPKRERADRETRGNSLTCLPETEPHRYAKPEGSTPLLSFTPEAILSSSLLSRPPSTWLLSSFHNIAVAAQQDNYMRARGMRPLLGSHHKAARWEQGAGKWGGDEALIRAGRKTAVIVLRPHVQFRDGELPLPKHTKRRH